MFALYPVFPGDLRLLPGVDHVLLVHFQPAAAHGVAAGRADGQGWAGGHGGELGHRDAHTRALHHRHTAADHAAHVRQHYH